MQHSTGFACPCTFQLHATSLVSNMQASTKIFWLFHKNVIFGAFSCSLAFNSYFLEELCSLFRQQIVGSIIFFIPLVLHSDRSMGYLNYPSFSAGDYFFLFYSVWYFLFSLLFSVGIIAQMSSKYNRNRRSIQHHLSFSFCLEFAEQMMPVQIPCSKIEL